MTAVCNLSVQSKFPVIALLLYSVIVRALVGTEKIANEY